MCDHLSNQSSIRSIHLVGTLHYMYKYLIYMYMDIYRYIWNCACTNAWCNNTGMLHVQVLKIHVHGYTGKCRIVHVLEVIIMCTGALHIHIPVPVHVQVAILVTISSCICFFSYFFTGHETKAMLNNSGPRAKRSKLERDINAEIVSQVIVLFALCLFGAVGECMSLCVSSSLCSHLLLYFLLSLSVSLSVTVCLPIPLPPSISPSLPPSLARSLSSFSFP